VSEGSHFKSRSIHDKIHLNVRTVPIYHYLSWLRLSARTGYKSQLCRYLRRNPVTIPRTRLIAALAFVLPVAALTAAPVSAATPQKHKHHSASVHKTSAHKATHKPKHTATPAS
jgi:hypothetical protein